MPAVGFISRAGTVEAFQMPLALPSVDSGGSTAHSRARRTAALAHDGGSLRIAVAFAIAVVIALLLPSVECGYPGATQATPVGGGRPARTSRDRAGSGLYVIELRSPGATSGSYTDRGRLPVIAACKPPAKSRNTQIDVPRRQSAAPSTNARSRGRRDPDRRRADASCERAQVIGDAHGPPPPGGRSAMHTMTSPRSGAASTARATCSPGAAST